MGIGKKAPVKLCDEPIGDLMEYLELMIKKKKRPTVLNLDLCAYFVTLMQVCLLLCVQME